MRGSAINISPLPRGSTRGHKRAGVAYMDGAGGVPSVRRPGKGREQERKLEGVRQYLSALSWIVGQVNIEANGFFPVNQVRGQAGNGPGFSGPF